MNKKISAKLLDRHLGLKFNWRELGGERGYVLLWMVVFGVLGWVGFSHINVVFPGRVHLQGTPGEVRLAVTDVKDTKRAPYAALQNRVREELKTWPCYEEVETLSVMVPGTAAPAYLPTLVVSDVVDQVWDEKGYPVDRLESALSSAVQAGVRCLPVVRVASGELNGAEWRKTTERGGAKFDHTGLRCEFLVSLDESGAPFGVVLLTSSGDDHADSEAQAFVESLRTRGGQCRTGILYVEWVPEDEECQPKEATCL